MSTNGQKPQPEDVRAHVELLQNVIGRMASNSAAVKTWCVTLVSAIVVLLADKDMPQHIWIALAPTLLFCLLDSYYLSLEKGFRASYEAFVEKLHNNSLSTSDTYLVQQSGKASTHFMEALLSWSVFPFYTVLSTLILLGILGLTERATSCCGL
jgi:hypothetical protein